jgi:hypothetical protein
MKFSAFYVVAMLTVLSHTLSPAYAAGETKGEAVSSPHQKAMMDAMMKAGAPGPEHKMLASSVGKWKTATKWWSAPGAEPKESSGEAKIISVLGGRFIEEIHTGKMSGMKFEGMGLTGYDNLTKKYIGTWADNMGTSIMMMTGTWDDATKTCTMAGTFTDPMDNKTKTMTMKIQIVDKNTHIAEFFVDSPDGKPVKTMEIKYMRKK